jgi:hypothetical protein
MNEHQIIPYCLPATPVKRLRRRSKAAVRVIEGNEFKVVSARWEAFK